MSRKPAALVVALVALLAACGGGTKKADAPASTDAPTSTTTTTAAPTTTTAPPLGDTAWVARAKKQLTDVPVFSSPDDTAAPSQTLKQPNEDGAPLVFLIKGSYDNVNPPPLFEVYLPVRPNGSSGFVRSSDVTITSHQFKMKVEVAAHRLTVTKAGQVVLDAPVGIGRANTPTPGGVFYIKELLKVPEPDGPYGPYAYGLSGFSEQLTSFAGGTGVIGVHGTNDPGGIGKDVSAGCIRLTNENIMKLVAILPLGTPVEILA